MSNKHDHHETTTYTTAYIFFKEIWAKPALFLFIFVPILNTTTNIMHNLTILAWDSNPWPQYGGRGRIHWAMSTPIAVPYFNGKFINFKKLTGDEHWLSRERRLSLGEVRPRARSNRRAPCRSRLWSGKQLIYLSNRYDPNLLVPDWSPIHLRLLGQSRLKPCPRPDCMVVRLYVADLHAVSWGDGPWAFGTPLQILVKW